jgi:hypothetical protein
MLETDLVPEIFLSNSKLMLIMQKDFMTSNDLFVAEESE